MPFDGTKKPKIERAFRRVITHNRQQAPIDVDPTRDGIVPNEELIESMSQRVLEKAQELETEIERVVDKQTIPVPPEAVDVRAAVQRLMGSGDGSQVSYQMYSGILNGNSEKILGLDIDEFSKKVSGNTITDARTWTAYRDRTESFSVDNQFGGMGQHLGLLFLVNELLTSFDAPKKGAATVAPNPGGISAQLLVTNTLLKLIYNAETQLQGNADGALDTMGRDFKNAWRALGIQTPIGDTGTDFSGLIRSFFAPADERIVFDYCQDFLSQTTDPSYRAWQAVEPVIGSKWIVNAIRSAPALDRARRGIQTPASTGGFPPDFGDVLACELADTAERLDHIAAIVGSNYTRSVLCCTARFMSGIGGRTPRVLKSMRDALQFAVAVTNAKAAFSVPNLSLTLRDLFRRRIVYALIDKFDRLITGPAREIISQLSDQTLDPSWQAAFACIGVEDLMSAFVYAMEVLNNAVKQWLTELFENFDLKRSNMDISVQLKTDSAFLGTLLRLVDAIIGAVETGSLCAAEDDVAPDPRETMRFLGNRFADEREPILSRGPDRLRNFQAVELSTSFGRKLPSEDRRLESESDPNIQPRDSDLDECLRNLPPEALIEFRDNAADLTREIENAYSRVYGDFEA